MLPCIIDGKDIQSQITYGAIQAVAVTHTAIIGMIVCRQFICSGPTLSATRDGVCGYLC